MGDANTALQKPAGRRAWSFFQRPLAIARAFGLAKPETAVEIRPRVGDNLGVSSLKYYAVPLGRLPAGLVGAVRGLTAKHARWLALALVAGLILFSNLCGNIGIDYGTHWDEEYQVRGVRACVDNLVVLPQKYIYGSVYFLVGLAVLLAHSPSFPLDFLRDMSSKAGPEIIDLAGYPSIQKFQKVSHELIDSKKYLLENRMGFFALSSLVILWVYLLVRKLYPRRYLGALGAAAFVAGSWELQYHARFLAVDAVIAQVLTLELLLLTWAWRSLTPASRAPWYVGSAIVAGIALSCKATGLAAFLPVGMFPLLLPTSSTVGRRVRQAAFGIAIACVTAIILQPGLVIDPLRVVSVLKRESWEYGRVAWEHPNLTSGLLDRVGTFLLWLWLAIPSPFVLASMAASLIVLVGVVAQVRRHRRLTILGGVLFGTLLLALISHPLMIVRNYLLFVPGMAVAFGGGLLQIEDALRRRPWVWRVAIMTMGVFFIFNERWLYRAATSISDTTPATIAASAAADLLAAPETIRLSPAAYGELAPRLAPRFRCTSGSAAEKEVPIAIHVNEHLWRSNSFGLSRLFYGARDVNYDWYTGWIGRPERSPLLIVSARTALQQKVAFGAFGVCEPAPNGAQ